MDISQARAFLARVNRLFEDHQAEGAKPSALERDLLMEYTRRFYEALQDEPAPASRAEDKRTQTPAATTAEPPAPPRLPKPAASPERSPGVQSGAVSPRVEPEPVPQPKPWSPVRERPTIVFENFQTEPAAPRRPVRPAAPMPVPAPPPAAMQPGHPVSVTPTQPTASTQPTAPAKAKAPVLISVPEDVEAEVRRIESDQPAGQTFSDQQSGFAKAAAPTAATSPARPSAPARVADLEPTLREIFTVERAQDLSDRLANAHIPDLTRGMALNERLQYGRELFGGDADLMNETLRRVNGATDYEEAAVSLASTARRFDWSDSEKMPTARAFAKLVWRRFA